MCLFPISLHSNSFVIDLFDDGLFIHEGLITIDEDARFGRLQGIWQDCDGVQRNAILEIELENDAKYPEDFLSKRWINYIIETI